jgi:hypothetical protein
MIASSLTPTLVGLACGFGLASVIYMGAFFRAMKRIHQDNLQLHEDNLTAAVLLQAHQTTGVQKVEETNMTALTRRLDAIEQRLLRERLDQEEELTKP